MNEKHVPDSILERYVLGELPPDRMMDIDTMVRRNSLIRRRTEVIRESSKSILRRYPPETMATRIRERAAQPAGPQLKTGWPRKAGKRFLIPALAAAAVFIFIIAFPLIRGGYDSSPDLFVRDVTRIKGADARIYVYRKKNNGAELLVNNDRAREKDLLQIAYFSAIHSYGMIVSIDGRGNAVLHFPTSRNAGSRIETNRKMLLPRSYELDDAPGFERFIFITSRKPIDIRAVYQAAEKMAKHRTEAKTRQLPLDASLSQTSIIVVKE